MSEHENNITQARDELKRIFDCVITDFLQSKRGVTQTTEDSQELLSFTKEYRNHIGDKSEILLGKQLKNWWNIKKVWGDWS